MNQLTVYRPRIPMPQGYADPGEWSVLVNAIFPSANSPEAVMMAINYCRLRKLDIMKKPVNIVSVWDSKQQKMVETFWPSINEHEITAARTGEWAGLDKPVFGPEKTQHFTSERQTFDVTFPEWCSVTVYRVVNGERCAFTEEAYWLETYARVKSGAPNEMWRKRPRGQLAKVAKAMALRAAFPEEGGGPTAEEMEGQTIDHAPFVDSSETAPIKPVPSLVSPQPRDDIDEVIDGQTGEVIEHVAPYTIEMNEGSTWAQFLEPLQKYIQHAATIDEIDQWLALNQTLLLKLKDAKPQLYRLFEKNIEPRKLELTPQ